MPTFGDIGSLVSSLAPYLGGPVSILVVIAAWWYFVAAPRIKVRHNPGGEEELTVISSELTTIATELREANTKLDRVVISTSAIASRLEDVWEKVNK